MTINILVKPDGEFLYNNIQKDPEDIIDLVVDYTQYFKSDDIATISVTGTNITIDSSSELDNVLTIFISAGTDGVRAEIKIKVDTATRTLERTLLVKVVNK